MPRVPVIESPQIARGAVPTPFSSASVTPASQGASVGRGLRNLGSDVFRVHIAEKEKADRAAVASAEAKLAQIENTLLYDPEQGALQRKKQDAFNATDQSLDAYDQAFTELSQTMGNDTQRAGFQKSYQSRRNGVQRQLQIHEGNERRGFYDEEDERLIKNEISAGVNGWRDPARIEAANVRAFDAASRFAARNGMGEEWLENRAADINNRLHGGVIDHMLASNQDLRAKKYFKDNRELITGETRAKIEAAIAEGSLRGESQRRTDNIMAKHTDRENALKAARRIRDPEIRDATVTRVNARFNERKTDKENRSRELLRNAVAVVEANGGDINTVPPSIIADPDFTPTQRNSLRAIAQDIRDGIDPITDENTYFDLLNMANTPALRHEFLQKDMNELGSKLSRQDRRSLVNLQNSIRKGNLDDKLLNTYQTQKQIVDAALLDMKLDPTPSETTPQNKLARINKFRNAVRIQIEAEQTRTQTPVTDAKVQEIVDKLLMEGTVPGTGFKWFFGLAGDRIFQTEKRVFEVEAGESLELADDVELEDIPAGERAKVEAALRAEQRPITPETIRALYNSVNRQRLKNAGSE